MKSRYFLTTLLLVLNTFICSQLFGQAVFTLEQEPICWNNGSVDSSLTRYWLHTTRSPEAPRLMATLNVDKAPVTVTGGTISHGWCCDCIGSGSGGAVADQDSITNFQILQDSIWQITLVSGQQFRDTIREVTINISSCSLPVQNPLDPDDNISWKSNVIGEIYGVFDTTDFYLTVNGFTPKNETLDLNWTILGPGHYRFDQRVDIRGTDPIQFQDSADYVIKTSIWNGIEYASDACVIRRPVSEDSLRAPSVVEMMDSINNAGGGDNLGNHIATQNLQLGSNYISADGDNEGISIATDGKVGINQASPSKSLLHITGTTLDGSTTPLTIEDSDNEDKFLVDTDGNIYIDGGVSYGGTILAGSDLAMADNHRMILLNPNLNTVDYSLQDAATAGSSRIITIGSLDLSNTARVLTTPSDSIILGNGTTVNSIVFTEKNRFHTLIRYNVDYWLEIANNEDANDLMAITDAGAYFATDTLRQILQELGGKQADLIALSGVAANSTDLGTFPGSFIRDNATIYEALADIEALIDTTLTLDVGNLGQVLTEGNDAQGVRITNVGDPVDGGDVVTLDYFNNNIATDWKQPLAILQAADNNQFKIDTNSIELLGDLVFMAGDRRIILDITGRDTFYLANNQFLYLDLSTPVSITGDDYRYDESDLDLGFGGIQEEDLVLFSYSEDPPKNIDKYSGILSRGFDRLEIQRASEAKLQMRYVPGRVEFTLDGRSAIIHNYLEVGYRDRRIIRVIWDTYPAIITLSSDAVYCLDLEANYVEDSRTRTYNASEALITILDQAMTNPNLQIPLLGEGIQNSNLIGSGLIWETYGQKDQEEKLKLRGDMMAVQALPVSESENLLAHDHHIFMVYDPVTDKTYQITTYQRNNVVTTEIDSNQVVIGRVYDAYNGELLVDTILLAANTVYANISTENERCGHPHSWQLNSDTIRTVLNNGTGLYKTDFSFTSVSWSNLDFFQCDFGAGLVDVDTAVVKTYLRSLGLSSAVVNPHNKLRMRNADQIQSKTDTAWYAFIETYEEPSADPGTTGISILIVSNDQGVTWQARGTPYNPAIYPNGYAESALVQLNDTLYAVSRGSGNYVLSKSSDFGWTWTTPVTISGLGLGTSASAHKYIDSETSEEWAIFAYNADNELTGHRTRLVISKTQDFDTFYTMAIYDAIEGAHYPSLDLFGGYGYIQWTTGFKINYTDTFDYDISPNGRDAIMASKFPLRWFYEALR
jgi:hypothetical protein